MSGTTSASAPSKQMVLKVARHYLKKREPSGYSLVVPDEGVMLVSDGIKREHKRWYVEVHTDPDTISDTRRQEFVEIMSEVEQILHRRHGWTVYLTSMLPKL